MADECGHRHLPHRYPVGYAVRVLDTLRTWSHRQWTVAAMSGVLIAIVVALPTAVIPNPIFGRAIEVTWWSYPTVIITGILGGLLVGTYVRDPQAKVDKADTALKLGTVGGFISFFAVGCPVCNKLVLLALGTSGAVSWFGPIQPILAVASIAFMAWALRLRLRNATSCKVSITQ